MSTTTTNIRRVKRVCDRCGKSAEKTFTETQAFIPDGSIEQWEWTNWSTITYPPSSGNPLGVGDIELCSYCTESFTQWKMRTD